LIPTNKKLCADWIKYLPYRKQVKIGESDWHSLCHDTSKDKY
jgi:hypothetical protein